MSISFKSVHEFYLKEASVQEFQPLCVTKGNTTGVFVRWASAKQAIDGHEWPCYKGFYTLEVALKYARDRIGPDYYIEQGGTPVAIMQANYELENQIQEQENQQLREMNRLLEEKAEARWKEIIKLQDELADKERDLKELTEANNEYLAQINKHRKTGLPYCNRTFECLSARLKMPQFTCITLQPLFEVCPEVEVIISKKARRGFYQTMIELQNFLMEVAFTHSYNGVSVTQCSMPTEKILKLLSYGMIDYIYSTGLKKLLSLGKNGSSQLAILLSRSQSKPRYTLSLQKVMGLQKNRPNMKFF